MRIATWNVERLKHKQALTEIIETCNSVCADIFVLTETDAQVKPRFFDGYHTPCLAEIQPSYYKPTENRVSIYTRYPCTRQYPTYDKYTALCVELETERGTLLVYGTIMGIYGNRHKSFNEDLPGQIEDFRRLSAGGRNLCIAGDFNQSFSDDYYYTKAGRTMLVYSFDRFGIKVLTADQSQCIDHIALSERFADGTPAKVDEWNLDKRLSDHKGIVVQI